MNPDAQISSDEQRTSPVPSPSQAKHKSRGVPADLAGWPSYPEMRMQTPGGENGRGLHQPGNVMSGTPFGMTHAPGAFQKSSHLPTPQSPGNMASYLLTRTPSSAPNLQPYPQPTDLPTEFRSYASSSPPPFRPHPIPTPEPSPLVARSRSNGPNLSSQLVHANSRDDIGSPTPSRRDDQRSRASTPPRTPSRQMSMRSVTPMFQSRPTTPVQRRPAEQSSPSSSRVDHSCSNDQTILPRIKDEPGGEATRIRAQLIENHLVSTQAAELRRPDYLKRMKRLAPSTNPSAGGASLTSDLGGKDGSLLWSSTNMGIIDSPVKGKRIALFQETSEESFEESLMAGGYGRYRSDRPLWKLDEDAELPNRLGDAAAEEGFSSSLALTEEERRKKARLAAFLDPPRGSSSTSQLFPVEIEGCGRVLMKVEPSEPQTPPKPTPRPKRSRKRKKASADMKQDVEEGSIAAPEDSAMDAPNWPDTEFPWRSRLMAQDGLSSAEQEERLRYIENFLDRDSDSEEAEERYSSPGRRSPNEAFSRSPRPGQGKMYPLLSYTRDRRRGSTTLTVIPSDPADAKTALLSKKSTRAVQLRFLRRRDTDRTDNDDGATVCICQGRDDGRPLVQCDACRTWYHLDCIGIQSTSELGREEDPWFCANCVEVKTPPPVVPPSEPTFVPTDDDEHGSAGLEGFDPPFLNAGLHPSPATPWTRTARPPATPPRTQHALQGSSGSSWDEPASSSSRGEPRTPQFNSSSAFGDMVRVYGMTAGRSTEPASTEIEEPAFDPTSTPSRGIKFGLPFTTPKDGRLGLPGWQGVRGSGPDLFHTPKRLGGDGTATGRHGPPLLYHGRVGEASEGPSGVHGMCRTAGPANVTPVEREVSRLDGPRRMQALESPLGAKRSRRAADS